jgi:exodeoxyribonuclease VII small subunit
MPDNKQDKIQNMDFEAAFTALQENIETLENEDLPLEKALERFASGQALAKRCAQLLEEAELQVRQLSMDAPAAPETED